MTERVQRVDLSYNRPNLRHTDSQVKVLRGDQLVWWYGPVRQNTKPRSIPLVKVHFRQLFNDEPGPRTSAIVPLSSLPHYRKGTIWRDGICISDTDLASPPHTFDVDFDERGWSLTSRSDLISQGNAHIFHHHEYPLQYQHDRTRLLDFKLDDGTKNLLIPCTEYFIRAYARNMEVCRALATLRWSDVMSVFFDDSHRDEYRWLVKPSPKMRYYDAVFLAHLLYDDYAERRIRHINAQFISQDPSALIFMEATPWFRGKGQLQCRGRWINGGKTFLCLNLVGSSQPEGEEIEWQTKKFDNSEGKDGGRLVLPRPVRTAEADEFLNEHSHAAPDSHSEITIVKPAPFKILGSKRSIKKKKEVIQTDRGRLGPHPNEATSHSSGEGSGAGKNIGKLEHVADAEIETQGFLYDIWNAFRSIMADNPDRVTKVNWYTPPKFRDEGPPQLITLRPIIDWIPKNKSDLGWVYLDKKTGKCRGLMVLRIEVDGENYFCFEIQPVKPNKSEYSGVFMKSHVGTLEEFDSFVQKICSQICRVIGRFKNMESFFPPSAKIFRHHQKDVKVLYRSRLINAFKDFDVKLK
ncbi:hypothetical protein DMX10_22385 [Pseudomonas sp. 57B-090624]|uniref:hypothetical protein n=1 Tax=Pseudomonas sp. 57B-090624 TaxID=2213080 RepID=UPI000DA6F82B|nr:hypothetical protein [Pseudomonas sp. 57B-090624]PZE11144.1 hypothetical protein DMX10_22385 [Pseudomonas sp. 57B-090624]